MYKLRIFEPSDLPRFEGLFPSLAAGLRYNPDILRETALASEERGRIIGAGFLSASAEFLWLLRQRPEAFSMLSLKPALPGSSEAQADALCQAPPRDFGLFTEFQGCGAKEIDVSISLLEALSEKAADIAACCPGLNIHRTVWCRESREAYADFLREFGFREERALLTLRKNLFAEPRDMTETKALLPHGLFFDSPDLTDPAQMDRYIYGNGLGFGHPDSRGNMLYRMSVLGARALTVTDGEQVLASVTVYRDGEGAAATEDIFCVPEWRRRGITTALLKEAFRRLRQEGFREVHLNVYEDNAPALSLYRSLGYAQTDRIAELWG